MINLDEVELTDAQFRKLADLLFKLSGITLKEHKKYLLINRLSKFVGAGKDFTNFEDYYNALNEDKSGKLMINFVNVLTTNFSYFFREEVHFDFFKKYILDNYKKEHYLRFWSAACSTGEEPYSLSIALTQSLPPGAYRDVKILATDISTRVLEFAQKGVFHYTKVRGHVEDKDLRTYFIFDKNNKDFIVKDHIKNNISFRYLNLLDNYPFKKQFDIVFLRNVLIYFDNKEKEFIINKIAEYLKPNGYLILGLSESLVGIKHKLNGMKNSIYCNN